MTLEFLTLTLKPLSMQFFKQYFYLHYLISRNLAIKLIYTHENRLLVSNVQNVLENAGFKTILKNEFSGSGSGELSFLDTWPEVWILDETNYDQALQLVNNIFDTENDVGDQKNNDEWICKYCNEVNTSAFDTCWNCERENA